MVEESPWTFLGFFAWYGGLALARIARASQLQLAQPFLTLGLAALVLDERPGRNTYLAAAAVHTCVLLAQRAGFGHGSFPLASPNPFETTVLAGEREELAAPISPQRQ
jgi:hypothetical protein